MTEQSNFNNEIIVNLNKILIYNHLNIFEPLLDNISSINLNKIKLKLPVHIIIPINLIHLTDSIINNFKAYGLIYDKISFN
jgi:hypothetical protein